MLLYTLLVYYINKYFKRKYSEDKVYKSNRQTRITHR